MLRKFHILTQISPPTTKTTKALLHQIHESMRATSKGTDMAAQQSEMIPHLADGRTFCVVEAGREDKGRSGPRRDVLLRERRTSGNRNAWRCPSPFRLGRRGNRRSPWTLRGQRERRVSALYQHKSIYCILRLSSLVAFPNRKFEVGNYLKRDAKYDGNENFVSGTN